MPSSGYTLPDPPLIFVLFLCHSRPYGFADGNQIPTREKGVCRDSNPHLRPKRMHDVSVTPSGRRGRVGRYPMPAGMQRNNAGAPLEMASQVWYTLPEATQDYHLFLIIMGPLRALQLCTCNPYSGPWPGVSCGFSEPS